MWANRPLTNMTDVDLPSTLVVINERNAHRRINDLLRRRGHEIENEPNGDRAVDAYVRMSKNTPPVVFLSLDVAGPLNGHLVGLEIREADTNARLVYVCSRIRRKTAEDVAFSAGAVAILEMPFTMTDLEEAWPQIMGDVPSAPGVSDLDELYPDVRSIDGDEVISVESLPPLPIPEDLPPPPEPLMPINPVEAKPKKKRRWLKILILIALLGGVGTAAYCYQDILLQAVENLG
jgi:CheY-like chemotaxis protein